MSKKQKNKKPKKPDVTFIGFAMMCLKYAFKGAIAGIVIGFALDICGVVYPLGIVQLCAIASLCYALFKTLMELAKYIRKYIQYKKEKQALIEKK